MRSKFVNKFQHDSQAISYDYNVQDESNPIRAGYKNTLQWVASMTNELPSMNILELGSGTGNLTLLIENFDSMICVDASIEMTKQAEQKLSVKQNIDFTVCDFLDFFEENQKKYDAIVSTYALHHLTDAEKLIFLEKSISFLSDNGHIIIGDLMFYDEKQKLYLISKLKANNQTEVIDDIREEFFWDISKTKKYLKSKNFLLSEKQFSSLSWGFIVGMSKETIRSKWVS